MKKIAIALAVILIVLMAGTWVAVRVLLAPERVRAAVEAQASAALGERVRIGSASARVFPVVGLELHDITIWNTPTRIGSVSIETGLPPLMSRRVENARVTVSDGRVEIPWLLALLSSLSQAPPARAAADSGLTIVSVRAIALRKMVLAAGTHELQVEADGLFQEDHLEVSRLDAKGDGTSLSARGALTSVSKVTGSFAVDAETLNLDALLALASAATPAGVTRVSGAPAPTGADGLSIDADVRARRGRGAGIAFNDLSAHLHVARSGARLQPLSLRAFGGRFAGRVDVDTAGRVPHTRVTGDVADIDVGSVSAFAGSPGAISGRLAGRAAVACTCTDLASAQRGLDGTGQFAIADGSIPGLQMVRAVVLAFGRPATDAPSSSGEHFSRITAGFRVADGIVATNDLAFASPDFDMRAEGTLSAITGAANFKADVILSRELSEQAGRDLVRYAHEGDRVVLPATLSGTIAAPRVFIDVEQALGRALRNELERRGRSLLDRLIRRKPGG